MITQEKFDAYVKVQKSGRTNMWQIPKVIQYSKGKLTRDDCADIMKNYKQYDKGNFNIENKINEVNEMKTKIEPVVVAPVEQPVAVAPVVAPVEPIVVVEKPVKVKKVKVEKPATNNTTAEEIYNENNKPKLTISERKARCEAMIAENKTTKEIQAELGVSTTYIYKLRK